MRNRISNVVLAIVVWGALFSPTAHLMAETGPEHLGQWEPLLQGEGVWPLEARHTIVLKNGKLLCFHGFQAIMTFDPTPQEITTVAPPPLDPSTGFPIEIFCSGHAQLPDGRVAFFGGGVGYGTSHARTVIFDPDALPSNPWSVMDSMPPGEPTGFLNPDPKGKRWYPTATTLSDGRVLVVAGDDKDIEQQSGDIPLIFDAWKPKGQGQQYTQLFNSELHLPFYPFMFQLSDGKVLYAGSAFGINDSGEEISKTLDPIVSQWTDVVTSPILPPAGGSAVMYAPDLVLKGGGGHPNITATVDVYTLDATSQSPTWTAVTAMKHLRGSGGPSFAKAKGGVSMIRHRKDFRKPSASRVDRSGRIPGRMHARAVSELVEPVAAPYGRTRGDGNKRPCKRVRGRAGRSGAVVTACTNRMRACGNDATGSCVFDV